MNGCRVLLERGRTGLLLAVLLLCAVPQFAMGAELSWSPLYVDFGQVPVGGEGVQTLTLTNLDTAEPISISGIEFTFNEGGVFSWSTEDPSPIIPHGGSIEVTLTFSPTDPNYSFVSADLWIYNDSNNAPALYIQLLGEVVTADPCTPLTSCGSECVDTTSDTSNCGGCGNTCNTPDNGTAMCIVGVCGFECDEGYEPVSLECQLIGTEHDPLEMIAEIIAFFNESRADGTLVGLGPGRSGEHRADALGNMLVEAEELIATEDWDDACGQLNACQQRTDSGFFYPPQPDFVAGENTSMLHELIIELLDELECPYTLR